MTGNSFGKAFSISTFGESHGKGIGVIIDGCPAGLTIDAETLQKELDRRKPSQSRITTQRKESDLVMIQSGVFEGKSLGTPISLFIANHDHKPQDYDHNKEVLRPSHADYTYQAKYGLRDHRGGGRSSARETAARVAAGAIAKILLQKQGIKVQAYVSRVGNISVTKDYTELNLDLAEENIVRCPDFLVAEEMIRYIDEIRKQGDTCGGQITGVVTGCKAGLGEPVFDKLHADLAKAMLSINACHGFEYGSGFTGSFLKGSEHNDLFNPDFSTQTNRSGGVQGGISNGADIYFNVAFKPIATIMHMQKTVDTSGNAAEIKGKGRHDPCVLPRAVPIVEAMAALVLADHLLRFACYR